jgi:hypothetical protein
LEHHFQGLLQPVQKTASNIWSKISQHMKIEWSALDKKREAGQMTQDEVRQQFCKQFEYDLEVVSFIDNLLTVPTIGVF